MKGKLSTLGLVLVLTAMIVSGCGKGTATPTEPPTTAPTKVAVVPTDTAQPAASPTVEPTDTQQPTEAPTVTPTKVAMEPRGVSEEEISDWKTYTNERYGYSLQYPPDCTFGPMPQGCKQKPPEQRPPECLCFLNAEDPDRVGLQADTGEKDDLTLATFSVSRLAFDPPPVADLIEYIRERRPYGEIPNEPNLKVGGIPAVRFYTPRSPQAFSQEEIYFIKDDKALKIHMIDVDDKNNRELYDRISSALSISVVAPEEAPEEVRAARDVVLAYLSERYVEQAPAVSLTWAAEFTTPEGLIGMGTYQYTAEDWAITISYPIVAPEAVVYSVVVANQTTRFQWEGEVDAAGQVTERVAEEEISDWRTYTNERYGYSLRYPPDCTFGPMPGGCKQKPPEERSPECLCFLNAEDPDRVRLEAFTGEKDDLKGASFGIGRLAFDPPPGVGLIEFIKEKFSSYGEIPNEPNAKVGGIPAVRLYVPRSPMAYSWEVIFFIKDGKLLEIKMHDVDEPANRELYDRVCSALDITVEAPEGVQATGEVVDGWVGTLVRLPPGSQFGGYFEREDGQRLSIDAVTDALRAQIEDARWTGAQVKVWGQLRTDVPAYGGRNIQVERLEVISGPAQEPRNLSPFAEACASSALPTDRWGQYWAWSAMDGLLESAWAEEGHLGHEPWPSGPGIGEWIILIFPEEIVVHRIGVDVGFDQDADIFAKNNRLKKASILFSKREFVELAFDDVRGVQMRDVPPVRTTYVRLVISEVYPGSKYDDTCISEIEVWGTTE